MINREQFINEIAEVVNRNSMINVRRKFPICRPNAPRIIDAPKRYAERVDILTRNFR